MGTLSKAEIATRVCEKHSLSKKDVIKIINAMFAMIKASLRRGERVTLTNFGKFTSLPKHPRKGRNPTTGAEIVIPEHMLVKFKPSLAMKKTVNKPSYSAVTR
jgi:integration host factor subunit alpha